MTSPSSGREVENQFVITTPDGRYFQSYESIIAFIPSHNIEQPGKIVLDAKYWKWSATTSKYRNQFLGEDTEATQKKINEGEYILANLN